MGDCKVPLACWKPPLHLPLYGVPPLGFHPHSFVGYPVHQHVSGMSVCDMGNISLMLGVWGVPPSVRGFWGHEHMG